MIFTVNLTVSNCGGFRRQLLVLCKETSEWFQSWVALFVFSRTSIKIRRSKRFKGLLFAFPQSCGILELESANQSAQGG